LARDSLPGRTLATLPWSDHANGKSFCKRRRLGALRAEHGHPEPFGVKYWELDNEAFRKFTPEQYAWRCVEFSKAMKKIDPDIKLAMCGYWDLVPNFRREILDMLRIAGGDVDLVARRGFGDDQREVLNLIRQYNRESGHDVRLCNTEWLAPWGDVPFLDAGETREPTSRERTWQNQQIRWKYAINVAHILLDYQLLGGEFEFACFNNLANTWGQNVIECPMETVFISAAGRVLEHFSHSPAAWPVARDMTPVKGVRVQAALIHSKHGLVVDAINETGASVTMHLDLGELAFQPTRATSIVLSAPDPASRNTQADPNVIRRVVEPIDASRRAFDLQLYSILRMEFTVSRCSSKPRAQAVTNWEKRDDMWDPT
jgi:alpha-L-arabinofuranosidase